ncbi:MULTISPECIES: type VII toxin-antitoxin system HepT family RNase toxin [Pseudomonas]|jgi:uncharacterized protein YutE (UPF0331/DUF86 family)|uniref:Toxin-antitoxin antitoxin component n=1 Tax=Pseudomonas syringae TaxID=317 RepID=A0A085UPG6_PSESX|nr:MULTISPECIES: HepT-like ribonuclease domain-containing protein [Pseudomonas]EPJ88880.1 hypothetical protein CFII64_03632 [Pseudomonas sp. CFII64]KFE45079.1 hypothetical protein IV02_28255 [Pseudomonas syringae]
MDDGLLTIKAEIIEHCVERARHEYQRDPASFAVDMSRQDAATFNIVRACNAALVMGQHLIRRERLGVPQSDHDVFVLLCRGGWIDTPLVARLQGAVDFRTTAVHDFQMLKVADIVMAIGCQLDACLTFGLIALEKDGLH